MRLIKSIPQMIKYAKAVQKKGKVIGLVPTMGFLHAGHLSLIDIAKRSCDIVVVSIFVNPTQFGPKEDFKKYPRNLARDLKLLRRMGVDIVFCPSAQEMYPKGFQTKITVPKLAKKLCGISRPHHFAGVVTVVLKLFNIVLPDIAVFGEKDYQQQLIIKQMAVDLNLDVKILTGKIVRERNGLAMSSRNKYLSNLNQERAARLYAALSFGKKLAEQGEKSPEHLRRSILAHLKGKQINIEYCEVLNADTLESLPRLKGKVLIALAARIDGVRLIDNIVVSLGRT
ncbi:MAG: pantoate--beta-alanine ligase [Candidatus Margulisbacteria bacterium]|nr:pantoate--beta-alanine ligase [Candidatus Margulisiibacteriota bacterium]MBU1021723.1 pantoate--beta-alanine ligase [Candidatus Margulisiibacteriota bacterium]MBU1729469.1 pantoate--beta-alanine ligase [Candidatus Margulisiibacteriota bacterium]MBU1955430.1 pantoate--beta-alanine ligase [Candidatus Margulisiibacteriota bacterium]